MVNTQFIGTVLIILALAMWFNGGTHNSEIQGNTLIAEQNQLIGQLDSQDFKAIRDASSNMTTYNAFMGLIVLGMGIYVLTKK